MEQSLYDPSYHNGLTNHLYTSPDKRQIVLDLHSVIQYFYSTGYTTALTCDRAMVRLPYGGEIAQEVARVEGLARPREAHEDEGLVLPGHHHVPVCLLGHGKDVGGHVLSSAASKHVDHLKGAWQEEGEPLLD